MRLRYLNYELDFGVDSGPGPGKQNSWLVLANYYCKGLPLAAYLLLYVYSIYITHPGRGASLGEQNFSL